MDESGCSKISMNEAFNVEKAGLKVRPEKCRS
jgi:hypothetical protein